MWDSLDPQVHQKPWWWGQRQSLKHQWFLPNTHDSTWTFYYSESQWKLRSYDKLKLHTCVVINVKLQVLRQGHSNRQMHCQAFKPHFHYFKRWPVAEQKKSYLWWEKNYTKAQRDVQRILVIKHNQGLYEPDHKHTGNTKWQLHLTYNTFYPKRSYGIKMLQHA